jgi:uncharacterized damage-inducible protein DinB
MLKDTLRDAIKMHEFNLYMLDGLLRDVSDEQLSRPIGPGHHSGMWVLGHLVVAVRFACQLAGGKAEFSEEWMAAFGPGSKSDAPVPAGVTRANLRETLSVGHAQAAAAIEAADETHLAKPNGMPWFAGTSIQTHADAVHQLLSLHAGFHIGQLSVYRRAGGKPPLF